MATVTWPVAQLDPIRRLHVVASAFPNAAVGEIVVDRPFEEVWPWMMDFEHTLPRFDRAVRKAKVLERTERGVKLLSWTRGNPIPFPFDVTIEPGWCLMRAAARSFLVLMAAVPEGEGRTRYAHAEAVPLSGLGVLRSLLEREVRSDLRGIARELGSR
jgi:hypothetical protein